jgi:hypothetical protein
LEIIFHLDEICLKLSLNCSIFNDLKCIEKIQDEFSCQCPATICQYSMFKYTHRRIDIEFCIRLDNNQITGFIEHFCPEENLQGFHWNKTVVNKGQSLLCPSPCTGMDRKLFYY